MSEIKTKATNANPSDFLKSISPEQKQKDGMILLAMFERITGDKAVMWGESMVGFGQFHYKSERSAQEGDWPLVAFSPRKQNLTLYLMIGLDDNAELLSQLGKHKRSVGCLYINKLADVDQTVLAQLIEKTYVMMKRKYC